MAAAIISDGETPPSEPDLEPPDPPSSPPLPSHLHLAYYHPTFVFSTINPSPSPQSPSLLLSSPTAATVWNLIVIKTRPMRFLYAVNFGLSMDSVSYSRSSVLKPNGLVCLWRKKPLDLQALLSVWWVNTTLEPPIPPVPPDSVKSVRRGSDSVFFLFGLKLCHLLLNGVTSWMLLHFQRSLSTVGNHNDGLIASQFHRGNGSPYVKRHHHLLQPLNELSILSSNPTMWFGLNPSSTRSSTSKVKNGWRKFSGFFQNLAAFTTWHRSEFSNSHVTHIIILRSCVVARYALGLISRIGFAFLVLLCVLRTNIRKIKSWLPVLKPRTNSIVMMRAFLSSLRLEVLQVLMVLVLSSRAMMDHWMVMVLKKVDVVSVSLQSSICQCPVDWELYGKLLVGGCSMAKTSDRVNGASDLLSESNFGYLFIMEELANKLCNSFDSILFLMFLDLCLCSMSLVVVSSFSSISDLKNLPYGIVTE